MTTAAVTLYSFVLFLHIAAVVVAFGGMFAAPVLLGAAGRGADAARFHHGLLLLWTRVVNPAGAVVLAAGLYLAVDGPYEFGDPWIGSTLLILIVVMGLVGAFLIPRTRTLAGGGDGRDGRALMQVQRAVLVADLLILVALFLMVTKPGA